MGRHHVQPPPLTPLRRLAVACLLAAAAVMVQGWRVPLLLHQKQQPARPVRIHSWCGSKHSQSTHRHTTN